MRMRVVGRRRAMRRPPRMRNTGGGLEIQRVGLRGEIRDARRRDETLEYRARAAIDHREAGRVIAAVFETADALDQDRNDVAIGCCANDATHSGLRTGDYSGAFLRGRCQRLMDTCGARASVNCPGGASWLIVLPPPIVAPAPIVIGATSTQFDPTCTSSPMTDRCLFTPS